MAKKILFPEDAKSILSDVNPEHKFNLHMGTSILSLEELAEALEIMDDVSFEHHVTKEKNDFSNWINHVFNEKKLADELKEVRTIEETKNKILEYIG